MSSPSPQKERGKASASPLILDNKSSASETPSMTQQEPKDSLPGTRRGPSSAVLATCSNIVSALLILSTFSPEQTIQARLIKLTAAAVLTCVVHTYLLCSSPRDQQRLSSVILALISGPLAIYLALLTLW